MTKLLFQIETLIVHVWCTSNFLCHFCFVSHRLNNNNNTYGLCLYSVRISVKKQQEMNIIYYLLLYTFKLALPVSTALQRSEFIPALATAPAQQQNQPGTQNPKNLLLLKKKTKDKEQD
jgi:hypothetical protein